MRVYPQIFQKLSDYGFLSEEVSREMAKLARLRNLIVHRYWEVDDARLYREAKGSGLNTIKRFIEEVEKAFL